MDINLFDFYLPEELIAQKPCDKRDHSRLLAINYGNKSFHGEACGNVSNPLRDYLSLESDRLISDVVIDGNRVYDKDYWKERILNDAIEFTETTSKLNELYGLKRGR